MNSGLFNIGHERGRPQTVKRHQFDCAFRWPRMRSDEITAALNENSLPPAVDAPACRKKIAKLASVATTDRSFILKTTKDGSAKSLCFQPFSSERDLLCQSFIQWHYLFLGGILDRMADVTLILARIENGDPEAAEQLLPLVYDELRRLAAAKLANENPGQTLQATALVHDAYIRLVDVEQAQQWNSRAHFFAAAAEAMRRILVESARRKGRVRHGGETRRLNLDPDLVSHPDRRDDLIALDEALARLEQTDGRKASLVKLRFFAGLTMPDAADVLGISLATAERDWSYARVWLLRELNESGEDSSDGEI
jgi:RNA polymerase sigma factor (TIGR02999 family)